ncbi:MAG: hypothetical protein BLM47_01980 [Candidatus Reconcilbacillus cellulovorans]|uniref:Phage capsid protein n=1 Tax=Candidatus Reconcilbacillus cellulovorans TaxID=1906605 RepID=A0A2A6E3X2_9BACL|nr:MAG: hypothetical protein BLM47_01980 [Candidatus Reconcilbacillus cellulovorans]
MLKTSNFTSKEVISLSDEIAVVGVQDTPLVSLLLANRRVEQATAPVHSWRAKTLDDTADISVAEGNENVTVYSSARAELSNVCQIFEKGVSISGSALASSVKSIGDLFASEVADRLVEVKVAIEKAVTSGVYNDGSTTPYIRRMRGIENWVDSANVVNAATTGVVDENELIETVQKLWDNGINGTYIAVCNATIKSQINALYKNSHRYVNQPTQWGVVVDVLQTDFGNVQFVLSRHATPNKLTIFPLEYVALVWLRDPTFELLGKIGDAERGHVVAEATLKVATPKAVAQYVI